MNSACFPSGESSTGLPAESACPEDYKGQRESTLDASYLLKPTLPCNTNPNAQAAAQDVHALEEVPQDCELTV